MYGLFILVHMSCCMIASNLPAGDKREAGREREAGRGREAGRKWEACLEREASRKKKHQKQ